MSTVHVTFMIGAEDGDSANVVVHDGPNDTPIGTVTLEHPGNLKLQTQFDSDPDQLADVLDAWAVRLREEHAAWKAQQTGEGSHG